MTEQAAQLAGRLCGRTGATDVIDASVAILARQVDALVLTGDPDDIARLGPDLRIERV